MMREILVIGGGMGIARRLGLALALAGESIRITEAPPSLRFAVAADSGVDVVLADDRWHGQSDPPPISPVRAGLIPCPTLKARVRLASIGLRLVETYMKVSWATYIQPNLRILRS